MSEYAWLAFFSFLIAWRALIVGLLPFRGEISHTQLQFYLTLSAGVMIGAAGFHVMPDAIDKSGSVYACVRMVLAIVGLFCIERFIAPHSHEVNGHHNAEHAHDHHHHEHEAGPAHTQATTSISSINPAMITRMERCPNIERRRRPEPVGWPCSV